MILQILSDWHTEFGTRIPKISEEAEALVIPGDICTAPKAAGKIFKKLREITEVPIIYVLGNHEFYYEVFPDVIEEYKAVAMMAGVHLLDREKVVLGDIRFLGATMWTDFDKGRDVQIAQRQINDFYTIFLPDKRQIIKPGHIITEFNNTVEWLDGELRKPHEGPTVVVTHHGPTFAAISEKYEDSDINSCFFAELDELILKHNPDLWLYGHTHKYNEMILGKTRLVVNPVGYPFEKDSNYQEELLIAV